MEITNELRKKYKSLLDVRTIGVMILSSKKIIPTDEDFFYTISKFSYKGYDVIDSCQGHETPESEYYTRSCDMKITIPFVKFKYDKETFIHLADYLHMAKDKLTIDVKTSDDGCKYIMLRPVDTEIYNISYIKDLDFLYKNILNLRKCFTEIADAVPHIRGDIT